MREEESEAVGWSPCQFFAFFCDASMRLATQLQGSDGSMRAHKDLEVPAAATHQWVGQRQRGLSFQNFD